MKNLFFIILTVHCSLFTIHTFSQPCLPNQVPTQGRQACLPEGITFTTQEQIDNFQTNYPGCTEIEGDVTIQGDDITNVDGLSMLAAIGGFLNVSDCGQLLNLEGLGELSSVGGYVGFYNCAALTSFNGLTNLSSIGGNFYIWKMNALTNLVGLGALQNVDWGLVIGNNQQLQTLEGMNPVCEIGFNLGIYGNNSLQGLDALSDINFTGVSIAIVGNEQLTSLSGLDNIDPELIYGLEVTNNPNLSICDLQNMCVLAVNIPPGIFEINNNAPGCNSFGEIDDACRASCLPEGISFTTQEEVDRFMINYYKCTMIEGDVEIGGGANSDITNLAHLNVLKSIGGGLGIKNADLLKNLSGLDSLAFIGDGLFINDNESLQTLSGLESLASINGALVIQDNVSLTDVTGLINIDANTIEDISIQFNDSLAICDVQSICNYLAGPNATVEINNNALGCNSLEEVGDACGLLVDELSNISNFSIKPNPFSKSVSIEYGLKQAEAISIAIYNHLGEQVEMISKSKSNGQQKIEWNAEGLSSGIYFCILKTSEGIQTRKLIKL